ALSIIDLLRAKGSDVTYHDPFVPEVTFDHSHTLGHGKPLYNAELTDDLIKSADCVVIVTEHSGVDYKRVCSLAPLVVDTRNALTKETRGDSRARIVRL
ncbi:MAG TPA: UDP-glucose/GDP-mannose dehydrogenase family protein, partial [Pyrinomonadaceae bacterium]